MSRYLLTGLCLFFIQLPYYQTATSLSAAKTLSADEAKLSFVTFTNTFIPAGGKSTTAQVQQETVIISAFSYQQRNHQVVTRQTAATIDVFVKKNTLVKIELAALAQTSQQAHGGMLLSNKNRLYINTFHVFVTTNAQQFSLSPRQMQPAAKLLPRRLNIHIDEEPGAVWPLLPANAVKLDAPASALGQYSKHTPYVLDGKLSAAATPSISFIFSDAGSAVQHAKLQLTSTPLSKTAAGKTPAAVKERYAYYFLMDAPPPVVSKTTQGGAQLELTPAEKAAALDLHARVRGSPLRDIPLHRNASNQLKMTISDALGNVASYFFTFIVDNTAPVIKLSAQTIPAPPAAAVTLTTRQLQQAALLQTPLSFSGQLQLSLRAIDAHAPAAKLYALFQPQAAVHKLPPQLQLLNAPLKLSESGTVYYYSSDSFGNRTPLRAIRFRQTPHPPIQQSIKSH